MENFLSKNIMMYSLDGVMDSDNIFLSYDLLMNAELVQSTHDYDLNITVSEDFDLFKKHAPFNDDDDKNMTYIFSYSIHFESLDLWKLRIENTRSITFVNCSIVNPDFTKLSTIIEVNFRRCKFPGITSFTRMFKNQIVLNRVSFKGCDLSEIEDMSDMFFYCGMLKEVLFFCNSHGENLRNMSQMFANCDDIERILLDGFEVKNVTDMRGMFKSCMKLERIPDNVKDWDVSNVTDMSYMFSDCGKLNDLRVLRNWNVSNVINMKDMFSNCVMLENLEGLECWDVRKVGNLSNMFSECRKLKYVHALRNWNVTKDVNVSGMFCYCMMLRDLNVLKEWDEEIKAKAMSKNRCRECYY